MAGAVGQGPWVGARVARAEDLGLITGRARYVADLRFPGALRMAVRGSPQAHALVRRVDVTTASVPGVVAVLTGEDVRGRSEPLGHLQNPAARKDPRAYGLVTDRVRHAGEPVA